MAFISFGKNKETTTHEIDPNSPEGQAAASVGQVAIGTVDITGKPRVWNVAPQAPQQASEADANVTSLPEQSAEHDEHAA